MAITKILFIGEGSGNTRAEHLENAIEYICNEAKTEHGNLVGGINCLPDFAYEQMLRTKELFGQLGRRQGYHIIISLELGEGTPEQMLEIARRFAEEFLGGKYEAVYSVHVDKEHIHGHIVFNSVNMLTGAKYEYKKGDWKYIIQPITNRLCEEYGLSIMPAKYSRDKKNMNRKQWEKEKSWSEFIEADVRYCIGNAHSYNEFIFLLQKLGYEVKEGAHLAVKTEQMKRFRRLDTISDEFTIDLLKEELGKNHEMELVKPMVLTPDTSKLIKPKTKLQKQFCSKIYRMRVVEKYRFQYKSTRYKEDLERMKELQDEYLFLCRKDIDDWGDVAKIKADANAQILRITEQQHELYKERGKEKRKCKTEAGLQSFVEGESDYRKKLTQLSTDKKAAKEEIRLANKTLAESVYNLYMIPENLEIGNIYDVEIPKMSVKKQEDERPSIDTEVDGYIVTKEIYQSMTDNEKADWIGIDSTDLKESMDRFHEKLDSIGICSYQYLADETDEFCRLEEANRTDDRNYTDNEVRNRAR